jgi:uncharacterized membrane protein (GlpM family)
VAGFPVIVGLDPSGIKKTKWHEYMIRFVFGGAITAMTGEIGKKWGPVVAGLFLAFPAIFPASATLIARHETERKKLKGLHGERRGLEAAAGDAIGTAMGSVGLLAFAVIGWLFLPRYSPALVLAGGTVAWFAAGSILWIIRKRRRMLWRALISSQPSV